MKRSVLKRRTPLRSTFRHDDDREERLRVKRELSRDLDDVWAGFSVPPRDPVREDPYADLDRTVQLVERKGVQFAVAPPVSTKLLGHTSHKRKKLRRRESAYAQRERFPAYMVWVKAQPCLMSHLGGCSGVVEADHAGERGLSHKAHDNTCVPLCTQHHRERTDFSGVFKAFDKAMMREWTRYAIEVTQAAARRAGVEVPQ